MEYRRLRRQSFLQRGNRGEFFQVDLHEADRYGRLPLAARHHRHYRLAGIAHAVNRQDGLVLISWAEVTITVGEILGGEDGEDTRRAGGSSRVNGPQAGVWQGAAPQFGVDHTRDTQIGDKRRPSGDFLARIQSLR